MKLGKKLLLVPLGVAAIAFGAGGLNTALADREARAVAAALKVDMALLREVGDARSQLGQVHASVYRTQAIFDSMKPEEVKAFRAATQKQVEGIHAVVSGAGDHGEGADPELTQHVVQASKLVQSYGKQVDKAVALTEVEANMGVAAMQSAEKTYTELTQAIAQLLTHRDTLHAAQAEAAKSRILSTMLLLGALGLALTGAAVFAAWVMQRRVVQDLASAVRISSAVAEGRLNVQVPQRGQDEIGDLLRSQADMVARLRESLFTVQQANESIGNAAEEIASGNTDLSHRTEDAASALQRSASSMEQLSGTVRQTADSARTANQLAASASSVAEQGGAAMGQVVTTMDEINRSAKRIGDIVSTIDGIAFQTNILALNASVEAARAGEQGRGFAVVANEVRNLAQRSAAAAREIKQLISSSAERVEAGTQQVAAAGATMNEIVASVRRVSDIIGEISAAAAEQSAGVGQVTGAVSELDGMTQQNAALVEQSAAASESLRAQARRLTEVLGRFELAHATER